MYLVPMEMPKYCNKCPFGHCNYNFSLTESSSMSLIDGKMDKRGTYGYVCNVDFEKNKEYTKVSRADIGEDIERPEWCGLKEYENESTGSM